MGNYYNVKADVYSWTMVLHAMLSLQRPFEMYNAQLHKLLVCQEGVRPTIYNDWPLPIQHILRQGWSAKSNDRPRMEQICKTLDGLLEEIGRSKTSPPTSDGTVVPEQSNWEYVEHERHASACGTASGGVVEKTFISLVESWTSALCTGGVDSTGKSKVTAGKRDKRSLLRTLEAHLVADAAVSQLLMFREHSRRDRMGTADYPQLTHLRSCYL